MPKQISITRVIYQSLQVIAILLIFISCEKVKNIMQGCGTNENCLSKKEISILKHDAENGNADSAFKLYMYYKFNAPANDQYEFWLKTAARLNHSRAMSILGDQYFRGHDTKEKGIQLLEEAAKLGDAEIQCATGMLLAHDPALRDKAIYWLRIGNKNNCEYGAYDLGKLLLEVPDARDEAIVWLTKASTETILAEHLLGKALSESADENTRKKGMNILETSAKENDDAGSQFELGKILYQDEATRKQGIVWLKKSNAHGYIEAAQFIHENKIQ